MNNLKLNKKRILIESVILYIFVGLFFLVKSCHKSEFHLFNHDEQEQIQDENINGDETFVSSKQAIEIAEKFFSRETGAATRAFSSAKVEMVKDEENNNEPAMYVVNYPEGGWAIVSATRNYFPVLAWSEENSFDLEIVSEIGASIWLAETKEAIRISDNFADSTKAQIRSQWQTYEANESKMPSVPQTRNPVAMDARILQLYNQYGSSGWNTYMSLYSAQTGIFDPYVYQYILNLADSYGSPPEYTIVGIKDNTVTKGPLLTTQWDQKSPFNVLCPIAPDPNHPGFAGYPNNRPAGCVAIAMAQIMKYHTKPALVSSPTDHKFNWNNMPDLISGYTQTPYTYYSTPALIYDIGYYVYMDYWHADSTGADSGSSSNIYYAQSAFRYTYGYSSATDVDHNQSAVKTQLTSYSRPVYMSGQNTTGSGHAWVCDGVTETLPGRYYFVEFFTGSGYSSYGYYSILDPGYTVTSWPTSTYFHMNWGWGGESNGWFYENNVNPYHNGEIKNYSNKRKNLYVIP